MGRMRAGGAVRSEAGVATAATCPEHEGGRPGPRSCSGRGGSIKLRPHRAFLIDGDRFGLNSHRFAWNSGRDASVVRGAVPAAFF